MTYLGIKDEVENFEKGISNCTWIWTFTWRITLLNSVLVDYNSIVQVYHIRECVWERDLVLYWVQMITIKQLITDGSKTGSVQLLIKMRELTNYWRIEHVLMVNVAVLILRHASTSKGQHMTVILCLHMTLVDTCELGLILRLLMQYCIDQVKHIVAVLVWTKRNINNCMIKLIILPVSMVCVWDAIC